MNRHIRCLTFTDWIGIFFLPEKAVKVAARIQPIVTAAQLGTLLQGARKSRKLTQAQLGARLGLSQTRVSELELAPGTLSVDQLLAICAQLGLQLGLQLRDKAPAGGADW
jgi:HTH-type transcriptional regulator/antitoxin HipB